MEALKLVQYKGSRKLLETLMAFKGRQFTINELAGVACVPFASTWRLVKRWESAGIVETSIIGKSRIVRFRESEYTKRLIDLLNLSVTPQAFTVEALKGRLKPLHLKSAYLFGSVAKGEEKLESDIDVAILAGKDFDADKLIFDIYKKYGTKIVPLVFSDKKKFDTFLNEKVKVKLYG